MITGICGPVGSGKNVYTMFLMEEAAKSGRPIYTNIELTADCPFADRVARIDDEAGEYPVCRGEPGKPGYLCFWHYVRPGAVVFLDEADVYFWCRENSAFGRDLFVFHKQHRKLKCDLVYI